MKRNFENNIRYVSLIITLRWICFFPSLPVGKKNVYKQVEYKLYLDRL
jgi:hypothetical protein